MESNSCCNYLFSEHYDESFGHFYGWDVRRSDSELGVQARELKTVAVNEPVTAKEARSRC